MTEPDSAPRNAPGRRGIPADNRGGPPTVPARRRSGRALTDAPRRSLASEDEPSRPWAARRSAWTIGGVVALVLLIVSVLALQPSSDGRPIAAPTTSTPVSAGTGATTSASNSGTPAPPSDTAAPLPATNTPEELPTPSEEPIPSAGATVGVVELNDAQFSSPEGWTIYGDELIEDARRTVRLSNPTTDARLQAVTLEDGPSTLNDACISLVNLQQAQFSATTRQLVVPIGVNATAGQGVRCGFTGERTSDSVANIVTFTLVSRASDSHVLMLRSTVPVTLPLDSVSALELHNMSCQASTSFGVPLPLC